MAASSHQRERTRGPSSPSSSGNQQIIDSLSSGIIALDANQKIAAANDAARAYLGARENELRVGDRLDRLPTAAPLAAVLSEVVDTQSPVSRREVTIQLPDGRPRELGLSASLLQGPQPFNGVIFLFTDLTERRRLERVAELNRQLAALGELTAGVVHELRSPVSVISGMAELLIRKLGPEDERCGAAETILQEAASLERSIAQFLGFARPYDIERAWAEPKAIAERAMQFCQRRAHQKATSLDCSCEPDLPNLHVDANRVAQALANILVNAVDAVPHGGRVAFRSYQDGNDIVFEVVDNGPGVQLQPGENLFAPFFTQKESGTGLGLTIAHRVIAAHEGTISYANRDEGGTRFEIRLPVEPSADEQ